MDAKERIQGRDYIVLAINILWQVWKSRNSIQFNREERCPEGIVKKAMMEWVEYQAVGSVDDLNRKSGDDKASNGGRWSPPPKGYVIITTDASLNIPK